MTEDQRIACLVHLIDKNGIIFPQDALIWKSSTTVAGNPLFKGVTGDNITLDDFCRLSPTVRGEGVCANGIINTMPLLNEDLPAR